MITNSSNAKITFAIPFYSTPEYLKAAIDSVIRQTRSDWKLIVSDDCSPHTGIKELVDSYNDARMKYYRNSKNLKQSGNVNRCLELADTEFVTLLHADDELLPNYAEVMLSAMEQWGDATAICCQAKIIDSKGKEIFSFPDFVKRFIVPSNKQPYILSGESGLTSLLRGNFIMCPTLCYRKSKLKDNRFVENMIALQDMEFTTRLLLEGKTIIGLTSIAYRYRRHDESATGTTRKSLVLFEEEIQLYNEIRRKAKKLNWISAIKAAEKKRMIKLRVGYFALKDLLKFQLGDSLKKFRFLSQIYFNTGEIEHS
jgi:glycosyltransferase involved in cell wall biosynthesis